MNDLIKETVIEEFHKLIHVFFSMATFFHIDKTFCPDLSTWIPNSAVS